MSGKLLKGSLVVVFASVLSIIGLFATDGIRGIDGGLGALSGDGVGLRPCPQGMELHKQGDQSVCVDSYEASASDGCPFTSPRNIIESEENLKNSSCVAESVRGAHPWNYVSLTQAQRLCSNVGKRLPSADEWYNAALGTLSESCIIDASNPKVTGTESCRSSSGMYDMIGNVWEWTDETVVGRAYGGRELPPEGYVSSVDAGGVAISTDESENPLYDEDYFWSKEEGVFGMIRGGFYGSESDAGLYTINASVPTSFASQGVGFRCVRDL